MSIFSAAEKRASLENPSTNLANPRQWLIDVFGGGASDSGVHVNESSALKYSAVWNATTILSTAVSTIPIKVYEKDDEGNKEQRPNHPASRLISNMPNELQSGATFKQTGMVHNLLWGNFYSAIARNGRGDPTDLTLIHPKFVELVRDNGRLAYEVKVDEDVVVINPADMIHVPGLSSDGFKGLSVIGHAKNGIGLGLATEKFGNKFFGNGANPSGVIEYEGKFKDQETRDNFKKKWNDAYGGVENAMKTAILEMGMKYTPISIPPNDAQFLETRKFGVTEISRWFNLPPHMLKDMEHATFSNIEQQALEFVVHSLRPWLVKWETEFERKLLTEDQKRSGRWQIKFNVNALLRGDSSAQAEFIDKMIKNGVYSINDGRKFLDQNTIEGGDRHLIQRDRMPLDRFDEFVDNTVTNRMNNEQRKKELPDK